MPLSTRFEEALVLATRLHAAQMRKAGGNVPYVSHLLGVASNVLDHGGDEDEAIAALLHDAVEDQGGAPTLAEIHRRFGPRVADIVAGCTDTDEEPKPPWRARKTQFLARLKTASPSICLVTFADKLHNVRSLLLEYRILGDALWGQFRGGRDGSLWYYRSIVEVFRERGASPYIEELARAVAELEAVSSNAGAPPAGWETY